MQWSIEGLKFGVSWLSHEGCLEYDSRPYEKAPTGSDNSWYRLRTRWRAMLDVGSSKDLSVNASVE